MLSHILTVLDRMFHKMMKSRGNSSVSLKAIEFGFEHRFTRLFEKFISRENWQKLSIK